MPPPSPLIVMAAMARKSEAQKQRSSLFFSNHRDKQNYYDNLPQHFNEEESDTESGEDSDDFRKHNHSHRALSAQQQQRDQKHRVVQADDQKREHNEQRHRSSSKASLNDGGGARHNTAHLHVLPLGLNQSRGNSRESTRPSYDHYRHQQPTTKGVAYNNYNNDNDNRTDEVDYPDINIEEKHKHEDDPRPLLIDAEEKSNRGKLATIHNPRSLHEQHQPRSNDQVVSGGTTTSKDSIIVARHSHKMTRPQLPSTRPRASLHDLRLARGGNGNSNSSGGERKISQSKEITRWGGSDESSIRPQGTRGRLFHAGGGHTYLDEEVAIGAKAHLPPRRNVTASSALSSSLSYRYEPSYVVHCDPNRRKETGEEEYMREGEDGAEEEETNDTHNDDNNNNNNEANRSVDGPPPVPRASPPTQPTPAAQYTKIIPPSVTSDVVVSFGRAESLSPFIGGPSPSPYRRSSLNPASSPNVVLPSKVHFSTPRQRHQQEALMRRDEEEKEKKVSYESSDEDTYVIHEGRRIGSKNGSRLMFPSPNHREAGLPTSGTNHTSQGANHTGMKSKDVPRNPLLDITKATANGLNTLVALMLKREYTNEYGHSNTIGTKRNSQQVSTIIINSSETVGLSEKEKATKTDEVVHKKNENEDKNTEHKSKETQQKGLASKNGNILVPANVASSSSSSIRAKKKGGSAPRQVRRSASSSPSVSRGRLYFGWSLLGLRARSLPPRSLDPHEGKASESYEIREEEKRGVIHSYMYHGSNDGTVAMEQMPLQVRQRNNDVQTNFADSERTSLAVLNHSDSVNPPKKYISGKGHQEEGLSSSDLSLRCDVMGKALQHVISENHRLDAGACVAERMFTERAAELQNVYDHSIRSIREELLSFPTASAGLSTRRVVDASTNTIMVDYYHGDINKDATSLLLALSNKEKAEDRGVQCEAEKETLHDKLPSPVSRINKATQSDSDATESKGVQTDYYPSPEEVAERCARLADAEKEAIRFAFAESEVAKDKEREEAVASALRLLQTLRRQQALLVEKHNVEVNALHIERNGRALRMEQLSAEITSLRLREEVVVREWAQKLEMCERAKARAISEMETVHEQKVSELVLAHSAMLQSEREAFGAATERLRAEADAFASAVLASTAGVVQEETAPVEPPLVSSSSFSAPIGASLPQFFELFAERFTIQNEWVNTVGTIMSEFQELKGLVMMTAVLEDHKAEKELLVAHFTRESEKAKESVREGALASLEEALKRQKDELLAERSRSEEAIRLSYAEEVGRLSKLAALYQHEREQASEELKAIQGVLHKEKQVREEERQETLKSERELRLRVEEAESRARIAQNAVEEARSSNAVERQRLLMTHTNQVFILEEQLAALKRAQWSSVLVTGNERREKSYLVSSAAEGAHENPMGSTTNAAPVTTVGDGEEHEEAKIIGQVIELSNVNTPAASPQPVPPPNNRRTQQQRQEDVNATTNPTPEAASFRSGLYGGVGTVDDEDRHLTRWSSSPAEGKLRKTEYNAIDNDDDQATQIYKAGEQKEVFYYNRTKSPSSRRLPTVSQHFVSPMSHSTFSYHSSPLLSSPSFSSTTKTRDVEERGSEVRTSIGAKHAYTATASTGDERRDISGNSRSRSNRGTRNNNRGVVDDERLVSSYRASSYLGDDRMRASPSLSPSMTAAALHHYQHHQQGHDDHGGGHINDNSPLQPQRTQTTAHLGVNKNDNSGSAFTVSASSPSHIRGNPFPLAGRRRVRHHAEDSINNIAIINDHNTVNSHHKNGIAADGAYTRSSADASPRADVNSQNNHDLSLTTSRKIEYDEERDKDEGSNGLNGNEKGERRLFALGRQRPPRDEFEQHPYRRGVAVPLVFDTPPPLSEKVRIGRGDEEDVAHGADVYPSSFVALPSPRRTDLHRRLSKSPLNYSPASGNNTGPSSSATSSPWSPQAAERGKVTSSNSSSTRKGVGTDDTDASTNSFEVSFSQSPPQHQQVRSLLAYLTR